MTTVDNNLMYQLIKMSHDNLTMATLLSKQQILN